MPPLSRRQFAAVTAAGLVGLAHARTQAFHRALEQTGLKEVFKDDFLIGTAVDGRTVDDPSTPLAQLVAREFNAITPTNMMKWGPLEPREGEWQWAGPDRLVAFGAAHGMTVVGHTLVWHSQTPRWLFVDEQDAPVSKERLLKRIETRIQTLVGRYQGRVAIWDVVNEAIDEDEKGWRQSRFLTIAGPEFVERAFRAAHEADPKATLLYNDYNEHNPGRRRFLVDVIRDYKRRGVPIHGVGFQGHVGLDYPDLAEYEKSLQAIAAEGLQVHVTELDVDVLPRASGYTGAEISTNFELSEKLNPWKTGLPPEIDEKLTARYRQLFELFLKYRETIARVSTWGTFDGESWKNNFPVRGRTNYPLLFDRELKPKAAYAALVALKHPTAR
ncbi:MAG TPA: endo-1,4-beta-xylanase [Vicinamibacterales bacterium]|jgi:endo-1,4-beta-xylanase|nr:endo-1,4-beta-xylanase [Vicinamibacterales bacterium]